MIDDIYGFFHNPPLNDRAPTPMVAVPLNVRDTDPEYLKIALGMLGVKEAPGPADNPAVVRLYALAGHPEIRDDEVAWCAAFVGACLNIGGLRGTGSLTARSYLTWGRAVTLSKIPRGAVAVFRRGNSTWQGHVAFVLRDNGDTLLTIDGNVSDMVRVATHSKTALLGARIPN